MPPKNAKHKDGNSKPSDSEEFDYKKQGNECMKDGKHTEAIIHYTFALKTDANNHLLYSNRSLAFLKEQQYYFALEDANKTIQLQPKWPKGWFRKGEVELAVEDFPKALRSYQQAQMLDPTDETIKNAMKRTHTERARVRRAASWVPWKFIGGSVTMGVLIVLWDQFLSTAPFLSDALKVLVLCGSVLVGYLLTRITKFLNDNQKSNLLEAPLDLLGVFNESPNDEEEPPEQPKETPNEKTKNSKQAKTKHKKKS